MTDDSKNPGSMSSEYVTIRRNEPSDDTLVSSNTEFLGKREGGKVVIAEAEVGIIQKGGAIDRVTFHYPAQCPALALSPAALERAVTKIEIGRDMALEEFNAKYGDRAAAYTPPVTIPVRQACGLPPAAPRPSTVRVEPTVYTSENPVGEREGNKQIIGQLEVSAFHSDGKMHHRTYNVTTVCPPSDLPREELEIELRWRETDRKAAFEQIEKRHPGAAIDTSTIEPCSFVLPAAPASAKAKRGK